MEPLATLEELKPRLEWTLESEEEGLATATLEELSDDARFYGSPSWISFEVTPRQVKSIILRAAARYLRNPDGYTQSRAGDETLGWTDRGEDSGSASFTDKEIRMLRQIAGTTRIYSAPVQAWGPIAREEVGLVPVDYGGDPIPFFESNTGPW